MGDDAFDDVGTFAEFAGAFVEMLAAGRTAIEHFARRNVVSRATKISAGIGVKISERRIFLTGLMIWQGIIHDRVLGHFGQCDVLCHVLQIRAVILPHDKKLATVAEYSGTDARLFEARILLHDGNVPAIEQIGRAHV